MARIDMDESLPDYATHLTLAEDITVLAGRRTVWKGTRVHFVDEHPLGGWIVRIPPKNGSLPMTTVVKREQVTRLGD